MGLGQAHFNLRQQRHHHRGQYGYCLSRGRGGAALALLSLRSVKKVYRIADTGEGRTRSKLRFEREELHTVERDMEEIKKEQDLLLKIFEDELLEDGEDSGCLPEKDAADHSRKEESF